MVHNHSVMMAAQGSFKEARRQALESFERAYLLHILERHTTLASMSRACGVTRKHLRNLLFKYGLRDRARGQLTARESAG
jgi:DNA-binding NtrC family response regulator